MAEKEALAKLTSRLDSFSDELSLNETQFSISEEDYSFFVQFRTADGLMKPYVLMKETLAAASFDVIADLVDDAFRFINSYRIKELLNKGRLQKSHIVDFIPGQGVNVASVANNVKWFLKMHSISCSTVLVEAFYSQDTSLYFELGRQARILDFVLTDGLVVPYVSGGEYFSIIPPPGDHEVIYVTLANDFAERVFSRIEKTCLSVQKLDRCYSYLAWKLVQFAVVQ